MAEVTLDEVPQKVRETFNKGFAALEHGNLDYAVDLLTVCVEQQPGLLQARRFLRAAEVQRYKQGSRNAISDGLSATLRLPLYLKTMAMVKAGKPEDALRSAEELLKTNPLNTKFVKAFSQAAAAAGYPEAAIMTLEVARDHHPTDISVLNWLGVLYQKVGRTRSARECFEKLCEICPNDPGALKSLKDAMAIDSMQTDGWDEASEKGGSYRDIIKDAKEATLLEQEKKAVKSDEDSGALIGDLLVKIEQEPANVNYRRALARLYVQGKQYDEARAVLAKAQELNPGDPELDNTMSATRAEQFNSQIEALRAAGDTAGAEAKAEEKRAFLFEDLQERVKRYPNDLTLRYQWGVALIENDYVNEAIQQFQLAQRNPKHRTDALYYLSVCFREKKQYDLAREQLEKAGSELFQMDDTKKKIYYELGEISEAMGDLEKAASYYKDIYQVDIGYRDIAEKVESVYGAKG